MWGIMSLNNIINSDHLRDRLKAVIREYPDTGENLAKEIGIARPTLIKFLSDGKVNFKSLCKIEDWIKGKEIKIVDKK